MSTDHILNLLRSSTMPIHKKLDSGGIGGKMRSKNFSEQDYCKWLISTLNTQKFLCTEKQKFYTSPLYHFVEGDLGVKELIDDCNSCNIDILSKQAFSIDVESKHHDYLIAIVYTFLGSSLGSKMIGQYVKAHLKNVSSDFLDFMLLQNEKWAKFKDDLSTYTLTITEEQLQSYSRKVFEHVYLIQQTS